MQDNAERVARPTVGDLMEYLRHFVEETPVYLDIDSAEQDGFDGDYVGMSYVSLSYALGEMEEKVQQ